VPVLRKIAFYLFLAASLGTAVWAYLRLRESKAPKTSVLEHIPGTASAVIETRQIHDLVQQLTRQNLIWNSLLSEEAFANAQKGIQYLDSLTRASEEVSTMLADNPVYWSFVKEGAKNEHLIQFKLKEQNDEELMEQFFGHAFVQNNFVSSFKAYDVRVNGKAWLAACLNGIVYFCSDLSLLQKSIQLQKNESLAESKHYLQLLKLNGKQSTQVFLNHHLSGLLNKQLFTNQSLFNLGMELNELTCTGYTLPDSAAFLSVIARQKETEFRQLEKLPDHASSLLGISLSQAEAFFKDNQALLPPALAEKNEKAWKAVNDSAMYNMKQEVYENSGGALILGNYWLDDHAEQVLQMNVEDEEKAEQFLKVISDSLSTANELKAFHIRDNYVHLFSFHDATAEMRYGCIVSGDLVLMSSKAMLNYYAGCMKNSSILGKNTTFMAYANDNLFEPSQYVYYENYDLIKYSTFSRLINSVELNTGDDVLSHLSLSLKAYDIGLQMRLHATHKQEQEQAGSESGKDVLWSYAADSSVTSPVFVFTNHLTQEHELCFQDQTNTLYLISSTGKALWKKVINESLKSGIHTVDIFKNGKLQMLFNTDNYLHLIDRNGNYVQGYPVKLPQRATSPMTVLDYDKTKDYRIFIACADKKIYNYSLYGIKTEGYTPLRTDHVVKLPIQYAKVGASDYLITADEGGKLYVFSRKGEGRINFKNKAVENPQNLYVWTGNNLDNTKIIYVDDKNNLLNKISLSDKKEAFKLGDELHGFRVTFDLLNDDKQMDMILYGDGAIHAYDLFSGKLFESYNEQAVYRDVLFAYTENSQQVMAFDQAGEKLDLVDLSGKPLYSIGHVTNVPLVTQLYKDGKTYLVTISGSRVNCRRLN
jgi:hypothetical protein